MALHGWEMLQTNRLEREGEENVRSRNEEEREAGKAFQL